MPANENPYASPTASDAPTLRNKGIGEFAPCPACNGTTAEKISSTFWGGMVGPRILHHVKCVGCGYKYNGKTGKSNLRAIIVYQAVVLAIVAAIIWAQSRF